MVDPVLSATAVAVGGYLLKEQFNRLCGPTADYLGEKARNLVQCRIENMNKIITKTDAILGDKINEEGIIHPRIIEKFLNSGSYIEDNIAQEYFAGVMATSRTNDGKDDSGYYFLDLITKLSHVDLKMHFILYSLLRERHLGTNFSIFRIEDRYRLFIQLSFEDFFSKFQEQYPDTFDRARILTEAAPRLQKEDLVHEIVFGSKYFVEQKKKAFNRQLKKIKELENESKITGFSLYGGISTRNMVRERRTDSSDDIIPIRMKGAIYAIGSDDNLTDDMHLICIPSPLGAQLFLWAHGEGHQLANEIFNPELRLTKDSTLNPRFE